MQPFILPSETSVALGRVAVARRPQRFTATLRLPPTVRYLRITSDIEGIASSYVRASYGELMTGDAPPEHLVDDAQLLVAGASATIAFNGQPLPAATPDDIDSPWTSERYIVDQFVWRAIASDQDWFALYGCAIEIDGRAIVLAGPSGSGKTTLALALALAGATIYGDEMILIHRRRYVVSAIARSLTIRPGTFALLGTSAADDGMRIRHPGPAPLAATIFVEPADDGPALLPISPARAARIARPYLSTRSCGFDTFAALAEVLAAAPCFRLVRGGAPHAAAALVRDALRA